LILVGWINTFGALDIIPTIQHDCSANCKKRLFKDQKLQNINFGENLGCPTSKNTYRMKKC
jgi:hypothetical protein